MAKQIQHDKTMAFFGMRQVVQTCILVCAGLLVALALALIGNKQVSLAQLISSIIDPEQSSILDVGLWLLELATYYLVLFLLTRKAMYSLGGMILGVIVRLFLSLGFALAVHGILGETLPAMFGLMDNELWILRVLSIVVATLIIAYPCRRLVETGFGMDDQQQAHTRKETSSAHAFSFNTVRQAHGTSAQQPRVQAAGATFDLDRSLCKPPEGFTPLPPKAGVTGTVNINHQIILEYVPEAAPYLKKDFPVRVQQAYIVPQLRRATIWLTWQQIFPGGQDDPNYIHDGRPDSQFQGRWVRIPAREYVMQMNQEYFIVDTSTPPAWMLRPAVAQEAEFDTIPHK